MQSSFGSGNLSSAPAWAQQEQRRDPGPDIREARQMSDANRTRLERTLRRTLHQLSTEYEIEPIPMQLSISDSNVILT